MVGVVEWWWVVVTAALVVGRAVGVSHRYEVYSSTGWNRARDRCRGKGGDLAKVRNAESNAAIVALLKSSNSAVDGAWLGAQDKGTEGDWLWITDRARVKEGYEAWCEGAPVGFPAAADCLMLIGSEGCWVDTVCGLMLPYVCEFEETGEDSTDVVRLENAKCRDPAAEACVTAKEGSTTTDGPSCWRHCLETYELALQAATFDPASGTCCCSMRCSCYETAATEVAVSKEVESCVRLDAQTACARVGYFYVDDVQLDRIAYGATSCADALAEHDTPTAGVGSCCCGSDETACCPGEALESLDCPTVPQKDDDRDSNTEAKYAAYSGVSCQQEAGFDDGVQCLFTDYSDAMDPTKLCWSRCLESYRLPLSAAWGRRATSECCCVTQCKCFEHDDDDVHLAVAVSKPGPNNDASDISACDESTVAASFKTFDGFSCRSDENVLDDHQTCLRHDFSATALGRDQPAADCWALCERTYALPLSAAYGDVDRGLCCCADECLCLDDDASSQGKKSTTFAALVASNKPGAFNDADDVVTCAVLAAHVSGSSSQADSTGSTGLMVFFFLFGLFALLGFFILLRLYVNRSSLFARRLLHRFGIPTASPIHLDPDDPTSEAGLVIATDVELMQPSDGRRLTAHI